LIDMLQFLEPDPIPAQGTVIVIPGRGEQLEVYRRFGERIAADAFRVHVTADPTVDGEGVRGEIEALVAPDDTPRPVVIAGSDTGALFAVGLVASGQFAEVDGLILAGLPQSAEPVGAAGSWDDELEARTTCPTHRRRISDDIVAPGALYAPIDADLFEGADLSAVTVPVLGLHGADDPISPPATVRGRYDDAAQVELVTVAGARHDVLNNRTHRTVAATVILWLERLKVSGAALTTIASAERLGERV
jgi:alpha-beta hydrolase superfamily lysophospholipase